MVDSIAFRTRARTIDHLGREQIADCPTAVSELWKNAYDAYAHGVELNIFEGSPAIATICDDGHGMSREEFANNWLVVGTESKVGTAETPPDDRNGLGPRTKQGQKGIGRLSSANLGPLLLVVSKRKDHPFVASLIDWRLFENPYLFLQDIEVPIVEFYDKESLLGLLPSLQDSLMSNVWGGKEKTRTDRDERIALAWQMFSDQEQKRGQVETTQFRIEKTVIETVFEERHFTPWKLWSGNSFQGTLLAVSDIQFDLEAQLSKHDPKSDSAVQQARRQLFQTLSNFTDPYLDTSESTYAVQNFSTGVTVWEGMLRRDVISSDRFPFDVTALNDLEHVLSGTVDEHGIFRGRVKAYGNWLDEDVVIKPAIDVPSRKEMRTGPFLLRIGTFEQEQDSTIHTEEIFRNLEAQAEKYAGLYIYRNGLRVLPYGREGSDFFRIESRRSKHAGREFWSLRRIFGRVALRIEDNGNLRDKAGREGLIDNRAAKTFRDLVEHILMATARAYFGTDSALRKAVVPDLKLEYKKKKALEAHNKQRAQTKKHFRENLEKNAPKLAQLRAELEQVADRVRAGNLESESELIDLRQTLQGAKETYREVAVGEPPRNLGALEQSYLSFRNEFRATKEVINSLTDSLDAALETLKPKSAKDIAYSELNRNAAFLHRRLRSWAQEATTLLESEKTRISELQGERNKAYHAKMSPLIDEVELGKLSLRGASERLEREKEEQDSENAELFEPYIAALLSLKERIDLAGLTGFNQDQVDELREEVDRLHGLAQLGITVEIIGHEMEGLEHSISAGLKEFPNTVTQSSAFISVRDSCEALIERLRFLSPLKLSGQTTRMEITGRYIFEYVQRFFGIELKRNGVTLRATPAFNAFSVFEQPSRLLPVFINLVNNAGYWVHHSDWKPKEIVIDAINGKVVIADSGPGVDEDDFKNLFRLFFSRKLRGGRGVGLYLCRTNLAAGGHTIQCSVDSQWSDLPGAKFVIDFKGGKYE